METPSATARNVRAICELEAAALAGRSVSARIGDVIASNAGKMWFIVFHIVWFSLWLWLNSESKSRFTFDPFPFQLLSTNRNRPRVDADSSDRDSSDEPIGESGSQHGSRSIRGRIGARTVVAVLAPV
jgi:hypothetical protein